MNERNPCHRDQPPGYPVPQHQKTLTRRLLQFVTRRPLLQGYLKQVLKKNPWIWERIKRIFLFNDARTPDFTVLQYRDTTIHISNAPLADQRGIGRVTRELIKALSEMPDVLTVEKGYVHQGKHVFFYPSVHWCPADPPRPFVIMIHDVIPLLFPNHFPSAITQEWLNRYAQRARQADHVVTISHSNVPTIQQYLDIPTEHMSVVYNGVSLMEVNRRSEISLPSQPFLVYLGSHDRHKNVEVVFRALQDVRISNVHILLIGENQAYARAAQDLGIGDRVHFMGRLGDSDVGLVLTRARALVFPSLYEGFGLPPLEAALLGVPVICSDRPAMNELIKCGGLFCDPDDPEQWANSILHVIHGRHDQNNVDDLQRYVQENYTWPNAAQQLLQVLLQHAR